MNIQNILNQASRFRVAVIGDYIKDVYIDGVVDRISPEAPIQILRQTGTRQNPGGAGNVVENLKGLGFQVSDFYGKHVPVKTRVMSGSHHLIRIDEEEEPYWMRWDEIDIGLPYGIENKKFSCVVISDYRKGCLSPDVIKNLISLCNLHNVPLVVDSKANLEWFKGATIVKCNEKEWNNHSFYGSTERWIGENKFSAVVVTRGYLGITYDDSVGNHLITKPLSIDVCDSCGAGDCVTAMLTLGIVLKDKFDSFFEAVELANVAGSAVCMHPGVTPINKELLIKRFNEVYGNNI